MYIQFFLMLESMNNKHLQKGNLAIGIVFWDLELHRIIVWHNIFVEGVKATFLATGATSV